MPPIPIPGLEAIVDHPARGVLELRWQDGSAHDVPHGLLRARCRCGGCEALRRRDGRDPEAPDTIRLQAILPVGDKALNLVFSDGHGRGIYPWAYLREIALAAGNSTH